MIQHFLVRYHLRNYDGSDKRNFCDALKNPEFLNIYLGMRKELWKDFENF